MCTFRVDPFGDLLLMDLQLGLENTAAVRAYQSILGQARKFCSRVLSQRISV